MRKILPFVWKYLMQQKLWFFLTIFSMILAFATPLFIPVIYKELINIAAGGFSSEAVAELYGIAWKFALLIAITQIGWKTLEIWIIPLETKIIRQVYLDGFERMIAQSQQFFTENFSGSVVKKIARLADKMENFIDLWVYSIIRMIITIVIMTVVVFLESKIL